MYRRKVKKTRLSVPVKAKEKSALEDIAERNDVSVALVIQQAIKEFLARHRGHQLMFIDRPPPKG
jgi:predicted transcriptional regulator